MDRDALRPVALAILCALAVVLASATLTSTVRTGGDGVGASGGSGVGASEGGGVDLGGEPNSSGLIDLGKQGEFKATVCVDPLNTPAAGWMIVLGLVIVGLYVWYRTSPIAAMGVVTAVATPVVLVYLVLTSCGTREGPFGAPEILSGQSSGGGGAGSSAATGPSVPVDPPLVVYVLVAIGLLAVLVVVLGDHERLTAALSSRIPDRDREESDEDTPGTTPSTYAVGEAAGRAADRIETGTDVENEVYRAWVEMTRHLDVDHPEASTPAEFAAAASEAGIDRSDVDELTDLFELVRYGGRPPTEERERRAVEALRRIEAEYGGER